MARPSTNEIILLDAYAILRLHSVRFGSKDVLIDLEDIDTVKQYSWHLRKQRNLNKEVLYVVSDNRQKDKRTLLRLHRIITNCPDDLVVDHINHNTLDNRKENLRICTIQENNLNRVEQINTNKPYTNNKLGMRFICTYKKANRNYYVYKVNYKGNKKETRDLFKALCYLISEVAKDVCM